MKSLYEGRLDNTVDAATLGMGEYVTVATRMGRHVAEGIVVAATPLGVALKNGSFYRRDKFLFSPKIEKIQQEMTNDLSGLSPDERTKRKLMGVGIIEAEEKKKDDLASQDKDEIEKNDKGNGSPAVKELPDDIKKSIKASYKLQDAQIESILYSVGDAAMSAMRKESVPDGQLFKIVSLIRDSVSEILKGNEVIRSKKG